MTYWLKHLLMVTLFLLSDCNPIVVLGEELAEQQGSRGYSECGYIWLPISHQPHSAGFNSRGGSVQYICQWSGVFISKFADDTRLRGAVCSLEEQDAWQGHLGRLEHWTMINGIKFNKSKCQVPYLGWCSEEGRNKAASNAKSSLRLRWWKIKDKIPMGLQGETWW